MYCHPQYHVFNIRAGPTPLPFAWWADFPVASASARSVGASRDRWVLAELEEDKVQARKGKKPSAY